MKRTLVIISTTVAAVLVGFGVWFELQNSDDSEISSPQVEFVPSPDEVLAERFSNLDDGTVRAAQDRSLAGFGNAIGSPLADFIEPGIRATVQGRRREFYLSHMRTYLQGISETDVHNAIEHWLHHRVRRGKFSNRHVVAQLQLILSEFNNDSDHPFVRLVRADHARRSGERSTAQQLVQGLCAEMAETGMPSIFQVFAGVLDLRVTSERTTLREREDCVIDSVVDFLVQHAADSEAHGFVWEVIEDAMDQLSSAGDSRLVSRASQDSRIPDFLVHMLAGEYFCEKAWVERGSGYANTVGQSGWHFFEKYMAPASLHFRQAWSLRPDLPFAAQRMIMIATAHGDEWSARDWFDLSVDAQFDLDSAYDSYLHKLKPRWGGSIPEMLSFGYECAATRDYSSEVGNYLYCVIGAVAEELSTGSPLDALSPAAFARFFENEELQQRLKTHWQNFDRAIADQKYTDSEGILLASSRRAACAMAMGDFKTLEECLSTLDGAKHYDGYLPFYFDRKLSRSLAHALVSDQQDKVLRIDRQFGSDFHGHVGVGELTVLHRELNELSPKLSEKSQFWLERIRAKTKLLRTYLSDEWVSLRFDDLSVWRVCGTVTVENDTTVTVRQVDASGLHAAPRVELLAPLPPPYKVVATVEPIEADTPRMQSVGIDLGTSVHPTPEGGCFICAMTRPPGGGVCSRYPEIQQSFEISGADFVTDIQVNAWADYYEAQYDGLNLPIPVHSGFRAGSFLSFGGCRLLDNGGSVRISNIRLHRLPARPDPSIATIDGVASFHESMIQIDPNDRVQLIKLADARVLQNRFRDARELLNRIREPDGDSFMTWSTVAEILIGVGQFEEAKDSLERMVSVNPADMRLQQLFAWILSTAPQDDVRDGEQALAIARQLVAMNPQNWLHLLTLSAAAAESGDRETAHVTFQQCRRAVVQNVVATARLDRIETLRDSDGRIRLRVAEDISVGKPEVAQERSLIKSSSEEN